MSEPLSYVRVQIMRDHKLHAEADLYCDGSFSQWGNDREKLGDNVSLLSALAYVVFEHAQEIRDE